MIDLLNSISKFQTVNDRESDVAFFRTHVPWVAPEAYLNIIYKPPAAELLSDAGALMKMPLPIIQFLQHYNGAILLSNAISLYGVVRRDQLLTRNDPFSLPPFNIEKENRSWPPPDVDRFLRIGGYGFDGSLVCIDRQDLHIDIFSRGATKPYHAWASLDDWLGNEIRRLSELFDASGRRLVDESRTLPPPL